MVCTNGGGRGSAQHWDYKTLMLSSVFSVAPAGNGLHSFRLAEAIFFGSIPVAVDDEGTRLARDVPELARGLPVGDRRR